MLIIDEMSEKIKVLNKAIEMKNKTIDSLTNNASSEQIRIDLNATN
jgi:hypothetical protein